MVKSLLPVKYRGRCTPSAPIKVLLRQLGLPKKVWNVRNFWEHWSGQLDLILHDAEKLYRLHARRVHPRQHGDAEEESKKLNMLWMAIKARFKNHMTPIPWSVRCAGQKRILAPVPRGFYRRWCALAQCGEEIITKYKNQKYCCSKHAQKHLGAIKYIRKIRPAKRRILLKCQFKSCGSLFWVTAPAPGKQPRRRFCSPKCCDYYYVYKFRVDHPEIANARGKSYRERNREKCLARGKRYQKEHREELNRKKQIYLRKKRKLLAKQKKAAQPPRPTAQPATKCLNAS